MKRTSLLAILALTLASGALAGQTLSADPSAPLDLQSYSQELERWSASARRLREHPEEATMLRKQLPDHWSVAVEEQRFQVSTAWLGAALDRVGTDPQLAVGTSQEMGDRLKAMLQDSQDLAQVGELDTGLAHAKLDNILKRREFRSIHAPSEGEAFWDRIMDRVWRFIGRLLSRAGDHPAVARVLLWGVVMVFGLAFLVWLVHSLTHISFQRLPVALDVATGRQTWREWALGARAAAARGEYRDAVRIIYGAAVRRMEAAGTWQLDPSRTHREYLRLLPADSSQRPPLVAITTCFERVWYGHAPASAVDYEAALADLESLG